MLQNTNREEPLRNIYNFPFIDFRHNSNLTWSSNPNQDGVELQSRAITKNQQENLIMKYNCMLEVIEWDQNKCTQPQGIRPLKFNHFMH